MAKKEGGRERGPEKADRGPKFEKAPFSKDKKGFTPKRTDDKPGFKKFGASRSGEGTWKKEEGKSFRKDDRKFGDKPGGGSRYGKKPGDDRGGSGSYGKDKPYSKDRPFDKGRSFDSKPGERSFSKDKKDSRSFEKPRFGKRSDDERKGPPGNSRFGKKDGDRQERPRFGDKKPYGKFNKDSRSENKEGREERPAFRNFSKSSDKPLGNERQVGMKRPPRYDKETLERKAPFKAKEKIQKEAEVEEIRLNRYIANAGLCSRREADELIASGMIRVNGKVVTEMGYKVKDGDTVKYGKDVLSRERMMYILLNKPKDYITTMDDPEERKTVMDLLKGACRERVYPVGRLDRNTTGLLLLTNDGELTEKLTHPSQDIKKIYQAELNKPFSEEHFELLKEGIELEDGFVKPDQLAYVTPDAEVIGIEIHSGKNRIVRRIFEHFGYEVTKLDRTTFAGLNKKELPRGKWRFLTEKEVIMLKYLL